MESLPPEHHKYFHPADYVVFALMFVISLSIGAFFAIKSRKKNTTDEYLMGGHKLGFLPITISICVSNVSTNTLLGAPAEMYAYGVMYEFMCVAMILAAIIATMVFVPMLYPLRLTSAHKYLLLRFDSKMVQYIGTFLFLLCQVLYVGCVIFGPATAMEIVTGIPTWASIVFVSAIGTCYTTVGGMKAVIWTDVFQSAVMLAGLIAIIAEGSRRLGGFGNVWEANARAGRLDVTLGASLTERFSLYSSVIGLTTFFVGLYGVNQPCVQRYSALSSQNLGRLSILLNGPGFTVFNTLSMMGGMVAFAYYDRIGCDPLSSGLISNGNQITPYFVMDILGYPGLPGLFIASLFSASLSTFSSSINSMAAVVWEDILADHYSHLTEKTKTWITKGLSIIFGIACMSISFVIMNIGGNLIQVAGSLFGMTIGPLLGVFVLGALFPFANHIGAVCGGIVGITVNCWLMAGQTMMKAQRKRLPSRIDKCFSSDLLNGTMFNDTSTVSSLWTGTTTSPLWSNSTMDSPIDGTTPLSFLEYLYSISFSWYPFIGFTLVIIVGLIVSGCTFRVKRGYVENKYLFPCIRICRSKESSYNLVQRSSSFAYEDGIKKRHRLNVTSM